MKIEAGKWPGDLIGPVFCDGVQLKRVASMDIGRMKATAYRADENGTANGHLVLVDGEPVIDTHRGKITFRWVLSSFHPNPTQGALDALKAEGYAELLDPANIEPIRPSDCVGRMMDISTGAETDGFGSVNTVADIPGQMKTVDILGAGFTPEPDGIDALALTMLNHAGIDPAMIDHAAIKRACNTTAHRMEGDQIVGWSHGEFLTATDVLEAFARGRLTLDGGEELPAWPSVMEEWPEGSVWESPNGLRVRHQGEWRKAASGGIATGAPYLVGETPSETTISQEFASVDHFIAFNKGMWAVAGGPEILGPYAHVDVVLTGVGGRGYGADPNAKPKIVHHREEGDVSLAIICPAGISLTPEDEAALKEVVARLAKRGGAL